MRTKVSHTEFSFSSRNGVKLFMVSSNGSTVRSFSFFDCTNKGWRSQIDLSYYSLTTDDYEALVESYLEEESRSVRR